MNGRLYTTSNICKLCEITARQLYYWEAIGLVRPRYESFGTRRFRRYNAEDLNMLKQAKALLEAGFTLQAVREQLVPGKHGAWRMEHEIQKGSDAFWSKSV